MENNVNNVKLDKKDINKVFLRSFFLQTTKNFERMQNLGFLYSITPVLKKVYKDSPKEERVKAIKRHLQFFNTNPVVFGPIVGVVAAMEEQGKNDMGSAIEGVKTGLMGPLAGLGDSLAFMTWKPICLSIGASFLLQGNPVGIVIAFLLFNAVVQPVKYILTKLSYEKGTSFLKEAADSGIIQRLTVMASILGLIVVGGLVPQMVVCKVLAVVNISDVKISFQEVLDKIVPCLLPMLITLTCIRSIKKGKSTVAILLVIMIVSILLKWIGVL